MAKPDPKNPNTAVRAQSGDSLSAIAKANNLTLSEIKALNPNIVNNAKYNGGKTIFSNTKINIAPANAPTSGKVPNFTPTITMGSPNSGMFIGPIPIGTTRTATGYVPEVSSGSGYSPGDFRKAEEKSNEPFYQSQQQQPILDFGAGSFSLRVNPTPPTPTLPVTVSPPPPPVKTATLDIILFDEESISTDGMFDQIFENIGGQELISITRSDIVNGQKISYQPIKNLSAIQQRYNPNNILSLQQTADKFFAGFSIKLEDKTPQIGNGPNGENVYLNATGDLIIEFININADEQIETQISVSGTIYEADLGDYTS
jgi:LysM repeat protein